MDFTPLTPRLWYFRAEKWGIFKSCPIVQKLWISLLRGLVRCLKVTLQTRVLENFRSTRTVKRAQTVSENPHRHTIEAILTKAANFVLEHFRTRILKIYTDLPWGPKE